MIAPALVVINYNTGYRPGIPARHRLRPEERREEILAAAAALLAREEAVTVAAAAKQAGVAPTLVYHYFGNAEGLTRAVADRERELLLADTELPAGLSPDVALDRAVNAYVDHFEAARGDLRTIFLPGGALHDGHEDNHRTLVVRILSLLELEATPLLELAIQGWLDLVVRVATSRPPSVDRAAAVALCRDLLHEVVALAERSAPPTSET